MLMGTVAEIPLLDRLSDYPAYYAGIDPQREAIVFAGSRISYAELAESVDRCARALLTAGIGKGDRVALLGTPRPEYLVTFLATARIGAIWLGLNPKYHLEELSYLVADADPKLLLAHAEIEGRSYDSELNALESHPGLQRVVRLGADGESVADSFRRFLAEGDELEDERLEQAVEEVRPEDTALIVYTSGSTGRPKGAMLPAPGTGQVLVDSKRSLAAQSQSGCLLFPDQPRSVHGRHLQLRLGRRRKRCSSWKASTRKGCCSSHKTNA